MTVVRVVGALIALVLCAWFGLGVVQSRDTDRAAAVAGQTAPLTATDVHRARTLLSTAGTLNPDRQVDLLRAQLDVRRGELGPARTILFGVVRSEPMNVDAWAGLALASAGDPSLFRLAVFKVRALAPVVPAT